MDKTVIVPAVFDQRRTSARAARRHRNYFGAGGRLRPWKGLRRLEVAEQRVGARRDAAWAHDVH